MAATERRRFSRMPVKELAYVNLDHDNGGTILNISEGGLCFQATSPVRGTETIRVWFASPDQHLDQQKLNADSLDQYDLSELRQVGVTRTFQNQARTGDVLGFVQTTSELMWTDETRTRGGLRFINLPNESRKAIRSFISQTGTDHSPPAKNGGKPGLYWPGRNGSVANNLRIPHASQPNVTHAQLDRPAVAPGSVAPFRRKLFERLRAGFSGGLLTGISLSAVVVGIFLLVSHTHALGDSLIRLGERLGGRSWAAAEREPIRNVRDSVPAASASAPSNLARPESFATVSPGAAIVKAGPTALTTEARITPGIQSLGTAAFTVPPSHLAVSKAARLGTAVSKPVVPPVVEKSEAIPPSDPNLLGPNLSAPAPSKMELPSPRTILVAPPKAGSLGSEPEKFLEIGRFKEKLLADTTRGQLSQLGFPAVALPRSRLFSKSYQVLVGPYENDPEAEAVHKRLTSLGFTPRSYERGRREFSLPPALKVGRTHLPVGNCTITWESYAPDAIVKFEDIRGSSVTVEGKWLRRGEKSPHDAVVFINNKDGSRTLLEIRLFRMGQSLVFGLT